MSAQFDVNSICGATAPSEEKFIRVVYYFEIIAQTTRDFVHTPAVISIKMIK